MRHRLIATVIALVTTLAIAGFTDLLDPLHDAVVIRRDATDTSTRKGRRIAKALTKTVDRLARDGATVDDDLKALRNAVRTLDRRFPADGTFDPLIESALDALENAAIARRDGLAAWSGLLARPKDERRLTSAVTVFDARLTKATSATRRHVRADLLRRGCKAVEDTAAKLDLDLEPGPDGRQPDFLLEDVNPTSATAGQNVSPRDLEGGVSAWYFGHAT